MPVNITTPIQQQIVMEKNSKSTIVSCDSNKQQIKTDISRANHTKLDNSTSSSHDKNVNNNNAEDSINKNYTEDEWEELTVAKRVHIINQRKINAYNKACEEFDKRIEDINKQIDKFGELIPISDAIKFLEDNCNIEIDDELIDSLQEHKKNYALANEIKSMISVAPKNQPKEPELIRRFY